MNHETELPPDAIAIVGMAGRFPGARTLTEFWRNIRDGVESITFFTADELLAAGVPAALVSDRDYVRARGVLEGAETFDAAFFGYLPGDVEMMDPQHRIFLECAWAALEDAGYDPLAAPGAVSVFGGMSQSTYLPLIRQLDPGERKYSGYPLRLGTDKDYLTTRVSYKLNLRGASMNVQTACSTSLVAVCHACQSLQAYQCDMALAGGVAVGAPLRSGHLHQDGGIFSPDGHCRPFDAAAAGTVNGDGVGLVVLKRLAEAVADGNTIHAVIRGFALNNDGAAKVGFTAPSPEGQAGVIGTALALAGVPSDTISYVEAHGTGTRLGDPIEAAALTAAFREGTGRTGFCALGSVKGNIGHTDTAAGVAGLIKTVLALEHRELPPTPNFCTPNPDIDFAASPFYVNAARRPWPAGGTPRRAGVSAFGLGGTNAHVVLEEAREQPGVPASRAWQVVPVSARTPAALARAAARLADAFDTGGVALADAAFTLQTGRHAFAHRAVAVGRTAAEVISALRSATLPAGHAPSPTPVAFLFPGGGVQYPEMARGLYQAEPTFRRDVDACLALLARDHRVDLGRWWWPSDADRAEAPARLEQPLLSIASVFCAEYALSRLWMSWGVRPAACIGHSLGEYAAACLAGVFSLEDALRVVVARGRAFEQMPPGAMLAVLAPETDVRAWLTGGLSIAAINGPGVVVVSGAEGDVAGLAQALDGAGVETQRIRISVAAHSAMLDPVLEAFRAVARGVERRPPSTPFISNLTGQWIAVDEATDAEYWVRHLREPVRFADGLTTLAAERDLALLEVGPGRTLTALARQQVGTARVVVNSLRHPSEQADDLAVLFGALGQLWTHGVDIDWPALHGQDRRRRISVPTYPFESIPYWPSAPEPPAAAGGAEPARPASLPQATPVAAADGRQPDTAMTPPPRTARILAEMIRVLHALSGKPLQPSEHDTPFLDLGFDSLFLGQASMAFQKAFGVRLRFRDFMETAPTPAALAALLDTRLPAEAFAAPSALPAAAASPVAAPAVSLAPASPARALTVGDNASAVERMIAQQLQAILELTRQQLAAVGQAPAAAGATPAQFSPAVPAVSGAPAAAPAAAAAPADAGTTAIKVFAQAVVNDPTGIEWAAVDASAERGLTPRQKAALGDLVARYCAKTATSKAMTDEMRPYLADPRAIVGFAPIWKETVYQIVSERSLGGRLWDVDGNEWIDVTLGFGSSAYGHSPDFVVDAIRAQLDKGFELGTQSAVAAEAARLFCEITGHERVCFCTAGTEAVMGAMRLARAYTGRDRVAMFIGDTHGRHDEVLGRPVVSDGEYSALPAAAGIAPHGVKPTLFLEYGNPKSLEILERYADDLAAVLVEPVRTRSPDLQPFQFLRDLRELARRRGITFIMDEVVTGFRVHPGGAQQLLGIDPDLSTWGKAVAAGMPVGVISGKAEYMDALDGGAWSYGDASVPETRMTNFGGAGTFAKHPLAMAATVATLRHIKAMGPALQEVTAAKAERLAHTLNARFRAQGLPVHLERFSTFFVPRVLGDRRFEPLLFVYLRNEAVHTYVDYPCFICTAHTDADIDALVERFVRAVDAMAAGGFLSAPVRPRPGGGTSRLTASDAAPSRAFVEAPITAGVMGTSRDRRDAVPLTPAQSEIWLATQRGDDGAAAFTLSSSIHLRGVLDVGALRRAAAQLVERHEALRVKVDADGGLQIVQAATPVDMPILDCGADGDDGARAVAAFLAAETTRVFDPSTGPLIRFTLLRRGGDCHTLVVSAFHMVCDGWSLGMICKDLSLLYSANAEGRVPNLPPAMPFREYVAWRAAAEQQADAAASLDYWAEQHRASVPVLDLPTRGPRPGPKTFNAARHVFQLDPKATLQLRQAAVRRGCTLFAATVAAFSLLLHRLSGQRDVVVGLGAAGQAAVGEDNLVGHCVSLLPYRSRLDESATFGGYLKATRLQLMDAYDHQGCSYGDLLPRLKLPRDPTRLPLVSAIVTHETDTAGIAFSGLRHEIAANPVPYCNFDVELYLIESADGVSGTVVYNRDLFDEATTAAWRDGLVALLSAIGTHADDHMAGVPLLADDAQAQVLAWGRGRPGTVPPGLTVVSAFDAQVARTPEAVAVVCGQERLTYAALQRRANQLARALAEHGVVAGGSVALALERSVDAVVAAVAVLQAGAAYVPLDLTAPASRLDFILADTRPSLVLTTRAHDERFGGASAPRLCLDEMRRPLEHPAASPAPPADPNAVAYVMYTSGSTGQPKGVLVPHRGILRLALGLDVVPWPQVRAVLHMAPTSFDAATFEIWAPLLHGATVVVVPGGPVTLDALQDVLANEPVDTLWLTAALFNTVVDVRPSLLSGVRHVLTGGEALSATHVRRAYDALPGLQIVNGYGPTETTTFACCHAIPRGMAAEARSVPIGRPIGDTQVYVVDAQGRLVPPDVDGELWIGGGGVALGYLNQPELTAERFVANPHGASADRVYRTGDRVRWLPDGTLEFRGRLDRQVKLRGFRVEPGEVEHALRRDARDAVVELEGQGEHAKLVAYVVQTPGGCDVAALRARLRETLPDYMVPAEIVGLAELPRTANGKLDRAALQAVTASRSPTEGSDRAERTTEQALAVLWSDVLGGGAVSRFDDFFLIGGHSLLAIRLVDRVFKTFGVRLPPLALFEHPRLMDLAAAIDRLRPVVPRVASSAAQAAAHPSAPVPAIVRPGTGAVLTRMMAGGSGAPFFWVHGIGGEVYSYLAVTRHLAPRRAVYGFAADWTVAFAPEEHSLEQIAAAYVRELTAVEPKGPYHLGGFCSASMLALEITRQLEASGRVVGAFAVLDYVMTVGSTANSIVAFAKNLPLWIGEDAMPSGFGELAGRLRRVVRRLRNGAAEAAGSQGDVRDALNLWRFPESQAEMLRLHMKVIGEYEPKPVDARVTLLLPRTGPLLGPWPGSGDMGWAAIARGGVDIHTVPGSHSTFMTAPFAETLARRIEQAIRRAEACTPAVAIAADTWPDRLAAAARV